MGGVVNSAGGFLGLSGGPKAPGMQTQNGSLSDLAGQGVINNQTYGKDTQANLAAYGTGDQSLSDTLAKANSQLGGNGNFMTGFSNQLAAGPLTGSKFATEQVNNNADLGGLYGPGGQLSQAEGKLTDLQNQGFNLKPEDQSLYGQEAGQISRQFGSQGNDAANNLAARGLSSSGAAGAQFSGLQGNQNEMLAQAQQQIAQQRFQNTMGQIGQYQNFVNSMGANAGNAINQQYGRQLSGVNQQTGQLATAAGEQTGQNSQANSANMAAADFNVKNQPKNFMDFASAGAGQGIQKDSASLAGGGGLFGGGK